MRFYLNQWITNLDGGKNRNHRYEQEPTTEYNGIAMNGCELLECTEYMLLLHTRTHRYNWNHIQIIQIE